MQLLAADPKPCGGRLRFSVGGGVRAQEVQRPHGVDVGALVQAQRSFQDADGVGRLLLQLGGGNRASVRGTQTPPAWSGTHSDQQQQLTTDRMFSVISFSCWTKFNLQQSRGAVSREENHEASKHHKRFTYR